jgi:membrane associated rhomboid family serine protease
VSTPAPPPAEPPVGPATEPVCPRHPDRVSYVRCQRCDRPTCPECQRQAAVGVQCVDCVREQSRGMRTVRTAFGGQPGTGTPVVTFGIILACVIVYVIELVPGTDMILRFGFSPTVADSQPYRFLTSAFLHSMSPAHILFNMIVLWQVGPYLEAQFGRIRFAVLYLVCAVGGSVGYLALADPADPRSWSSVAVGASGAVFGLFGALLVVQRRLGQSSQGVLIFIGINAVLGFTLANVAWQAHLGGLLTGAAMGLVLAAPVKPSQRNVVQVVGTWVVLGALTAISLWKLSTALY